MDLGEELCLACGLCCDGSLFDNVRLGEGDDADRLKSVGLPLKRSRAKAPVTFFPQPCSALCADRRCRVYANRPTQCRSFECQVFKDAMAGKLELAAAARVVKQARRKADEVRHLLRELGDRDESLSLTKRFRRAQKSVLSGGVDEASADVFGQLSLAMHQLDLLAHKRFHTVA